MVQRAKQRRPERAPTHPAPKANATQAAADSSPPTVYPDQFAEQASGDAAPKRGAQMQQRQPGGRVGPDGSVPIEVGATEIKDRTTFEALARRDNVPGAQGVREVKFVMTDVDTKNPKLYFVNSNTYDLHHSFVSQGLGVPLTREEFDRQTYFNPHRKYLAGTLVARDGFDAGGSKKGLYTLEFWPTDPVPKELIANAYTSIQKHMPIAPGDSLRYHPTGDTQEGLLNENERYLRQHGVRTIGTEQLYKGIPYQPMNPGVGFGVLRLLEGKPGEAPPSARDVVVLKTLPNDLTHVAGVISETPQTPLSHVNLKAKQNDTPNSYVKNATTDPKVKGLVGKVVRYEVGPDGYQLREATQEEADAYLEKLRPPTWRQAESDLSVREVKSFETMRHADVIAFGAKAANIGELRQIMEQRAQARARENQGWSAHAQGAVPKGDPVQSPEGFGVPFSFYDDFMKANGFDKKAQAMMDDAEFKKSPAVREKKLAELQAAMIAAPVPPELEAKLDALQKQFPKGTSLRCRSSTNNEDLEGFNGAGLYDSYTHKPKEGHLSNTVKQVWASLWNYRAFEEREFHKIDHLSAKMGVAVHRNSKDEQANGVAVTKNIFDPTLPGFYVNAQAGENLVTNPDANTTPDEFLVSPIGPHGEYERQFIRHSSVLEAGKTALLDDAQTNELTKTLELIQEHFREVYGKSVDDQSFAMDVEFKIERDGTLYVKQARPWVE